MSSTLTTYRDLVVNLKFMVAGAEDASEAKRSREGPKRIRITKRDLENYGYTGGCPRCADLEYGHANTKKAHNEECRARMYLKHKEMSDEKWAQAARDLQQQASNLAASSRVRPAVEPDDDAEVAIDAVDRAEAEWQRRVKPRRNQPDPAPSADLGSPPDSDDDEGPSPPAAKRSRVLDPVEADAEDEVADLFGDFDGGDDDELNAANVNHLIGALVSAGVDHPIAVAKANSMARGTPLSSTLKATFVEQYGRGAINREANGPRRDLNVEGLGACDLRTTNPTARPGTFHFEVIGGRQWISLTS